jgi:hypothetical protein
MTVLYEAAEASGLVSASTLLHGMITALCAMKVHIHTHAHMQIVCSAVVSAGHRNAPERT